MICSQSQSIQTECICLPRHSVTKTWVAPTPASLLCLNNWPDNSLSNLTYDKNFSTCQMWKCLKWMAFADRFLWNWMGNYFKITLPWCFLFHERLCATAWTKDLPLTHWGPDKMADILQTTFQNAFSWMKHLNYKHNFIYRCLFVRRHHYLNQWWTSLLLYVCVTRPQWVNMLTSLLGRKSSSNTLQDTIWLLTTQWGKLW